MERSLAALVACSIAFGTVAQASPISQSRIAELMASRDRQEVKLEALRSRDREILAQLGEMLSEKYGSLLEGSEMVFTRLVESGTVYYRMDFLGLKGKDRARALCEILDVEKCIALGPHGQMTLLQVDGEVTVSAMGVVSDNRPFVVADAVPAESFNPKAREIESRVRKMLDPLGIFPIPRPHDIASEAPATPSPQTVPPETRPKEVTDTSGETTAPASAPTDVVIRPRPRPEPQAGSGISIIEYFEEPEGANAAEVDLVLDEEDGAMQVDGSEEAADTQIEEILPTVLEEPAGGPVVEAGEMPDGGDDALPPLLEEVPGEPGEGEDDLRPLLEEPVDAPYVPPVEEPVDADLEPNDGVVGTADQPHRNDPDTRRAAPADQVLDRGAAPGAIGSEDDAGAADPSVAPRPEIGKEAGQNDRAPDDAGRAGVLILTPDQQVAPDAPDAPDVRDGNTPGREDSPSSDAEILSPDAHSGRILPTRANGTDVADAGRSDFLRSAFAGGNIGSGLAGRARDVAVRIPGVGKVEINRLERAIPGLSGDGIARFPAVRGPERTEVEGPSVRPMTVPTRDAVEVAEPASAPAVDLASTSATEDMIQAEVVASGATIGLESDRGVAEADPTRASQDEAETAASEPPAPVSRARALASIAPAEEDVEAVAPLRSLAQGPVPRERAMGELQARLDAAEPVPVMASLPLPRSDVLVVPVSAGRQTVELVSMSFDDPKIAAAEASHPAPKARPDMQLAQASAEKDVAPAIAIAAPAREAVDGEVVQQAPALALAALPPVVAPLGAPSEKPRYSVRVPLTESVASVGESDPGVRISKSSGVEIALLGSVAFDDQFAVPSSVDFAGGRDAGRLQKLPDARPDLSSYERHAQADTLHLDQSAARLALDVSEGRMASTDLAQVPGMGAAPSPDQGMAPPGFFGDEPARPAKPRSPSLNRLDSLLAEEVSGTQEAPEAGDDNARDAMSLFAEREGATDPAPVENGAQAQVHAEAAEETPAVRPSGLSGLDALRAMARPVPQPTVETTVQAAPEPDTAPRRPAVIATAQRAPVLTPAPTPVQTPEVETPRPDASGEKARRQALEILAQIQQAAEMERAAAPRPAAESAPLEARTEPGLVERRDASPEPQTEFDVADLRIELSYVASRDEVMERAQELKAFFPPVMVEKGRFFGAAVPGNPGRYIVGIEARDLKSRDDLIWYMDQMGVPWAQRAS